jgi:hypothetical protein
MTSAMGSSLGDDEFAGAGRRFDLSRRVVLADLADAGKCDDLPGDGHGYGLERREHADRDGELHVIADVVVVRELGQRLDRGSCPSWRQQEPWYAS